MTTKTKTTRAPKGTPTRLNLFTLARAAAGRREFPNRLEPTSVAGIRRCLKAGLVEVVGANLRITDAGVAAINAVPNLYAPRIEVAS